MGRHNVQIQTPAGRTQVRPSGIELQKWRNSREYTFRKTRQELPKYLH